MVFSFSILRTTNNELRDWLIVFDTKIANLGIIKSIFVVTFVILKLIIINP